MNVSQIYILISILVLAVIALLVFLVGKKGTRQITPLAGIAFAFVLAGILFGENRLIGYGLMGVGVILAVIDMIYKLIRADRP